MTSEPNTINPVEETENKFVSIMKLIWKKIKSLFKNPTFIYIMKRIGSGLITLFLIATVVFLLLRMVPKAGYYGDMTKMSKDAQEIYKAAIDKEMGFDKPVIVQLLYFWWDILPIPREYCLANKFTDNTYTELICSKSKVYVMYLGKSNIYELNKPVTEILTDRMGISFAISIISTIITYVVAYPFGVLMAKNKGKLFDKIGNAFIVLNLAIPSLVFYFIIWIFCLEIGLGGSYSPTEKNYYLLIGPIFAIVFLSVPGTAMWVRRFMVDEGDADYVKFARSKGLTENRIMFTHVLRNAMVPLVRNFPAAFVGSIIGSYYVEMVWSIPGTGSLMIKAMDATKPDCSLVQGLTIIYAAISMISFILGDIVTVFADPRIKLSK